MGEERLLHALIVRYDKAYLLTAAALKEEFADHYSQFFEAIRSMKINKSVFEQIPSLDKRAKLQARVLQLKEKKKRHSRLNNKSKLYKLLSPSSMKTIVRWAISGKIISLKK